MKAIIWFGRDNHGLGNYTIGVHVAVVESVEIQYVGQDRRPFVRSHGAVLRREFCGTRPAADKTIGELDAEGIDLVDLRRRNDSGDAIELDDTPLRST